MTQPPERLDARGAVDLSSLGRTRTPAPGGPTPAEPGPVVDVTDAAFAQLVELSLQVPVIVSMWASWSEAGKELTADLVAAVRDLGGRLVLGRVDIEANPQIAQAFGPQAGSVVAVLQGQPVALPPLEQATPAERRAVLDQLLVLAAENGVTGTIDGPPAAEAEPEEPPLPPRHQEAYEAIERDDLDAAVAAYDAALTENPKDELARVGRAQVELMRRTREVDPALARAAAAAAPADVAAQLVVADLDVLGGQVTAAFDRLLDCVRTTTAEDREVARTRLVELFAVVGDADPRVGAARRALAASLY